MELFFIILFLFFSQCVNAQVVINEFAVQPTQTVEVFNTASVSADISHWYIDDSGGSTYYTIPANTILLPQTCAVFTGDFNLNKSSADTVRLFTAEYPPTTPSAVLIDSYAYTTSPLASLARNPDGGVVWQETSSSFGLLNATGISCLPPPTPTLTPEPTPTGYIYVSPTPISTPTPSPEPTVIPDYDYITISEVYPYPADGEKEWVELYNGNDFTVNLEGWYIDDAAGSGSSPKKLTLSIPATSYGTVTFSSSLFNNAGDTVRLLNAAQTEKDSMEYTHAQKQKSFGLIEQTEQEYCIQDPSPNAPNTECLEPTISPKPTVAYILPTLKQSLQMKGVASVQNSPQTSPKTLSVLPQTSLSTLPQSGEPVVLGAIAPRHVSPTPYFSLTSFAYSLLTIVSVFIKINHA